MRICVTYLCGKGTRGKDSPVLGAKWLSSWKADGMSTTFALSAPEGWTYVRLDTRARVGRR